VFGKTPRLLFRHPTSFIGNSRQGRFFSAGSSFFFNALALRFFRDSARLLFCSR
jgi:hypothetical protein